MVPDFPDFFKNSKFLRDEVRAKLQIIFKNLEIIFGWSPQILVGIGAPPCTESGGEPLTVETPMKSLWVFLVLHFD